MKTIKELYSLPSKRIMNGLWGVEVEVEGKNLPAPEDQWLGPHWHVTLDGSLEVGKSYEYVMPKPLSFDGCMEAIDILQDAFKQNKSKVDEAVRAGVHVHMNVQEWDIKQVMTFASVYFLLETMLVRWCGTYREGNLFCLRTQDAEYLLFALQRALEERNLRYINDENIRYSSLNFCSLAKYGSLEFRAMRSTPELKVVKKWVALLQEMRNNSLLFSDPREVIMSMSGDGEEGFIRRILPTLWEEVYYDGCTKSVRQAARRVQMLAFTIDWNSLSRKSKNPFGEGREGF